MTADELANDNAVVAPAGTGEAGVPRWVKVLGVVVIVVIVVVVAMLLAGGDHGPGRHT